MSFPKHIKPGDIVFLGDSLTESFDLQKHFGRNDIHNRGISGNLTDHVLYRLEEISNTQPSQIFLMIGVNDIFQGYSLERIVNNIEKIIEQLLLTCPPTRIYLQSILPVNPDKLFADPAINTKIYQINLMLNALCRNRKITYLDIYPDFLNNMGELDGKYNYDGVHLSETGYVLWAELTKKYLDN